MRRKHWAVRVLLAILLAVAAFHAGTRYQKHRASILAFWSDPLRRDHEKAPAVPAPVPQVVAVQKAVEPPASRHSVRALDSVLLPLLVDTIDVAASGGL
jgi:hypothetical protein